MMRKHEILDDERRARIAEMSHCGIEALRPPEVPFGIRALECGIQVEGIWNAASGMQGLRHGLSVSSPNIDVTLRDTANLDTSSNLRRYSLESRSFGSCQNRSHERQSPVSSIGSAPSSVQDVFYPARSIISDSDSTEPSASRKKSSALLQQPSELPFQKQDCQPSSSSDIPKLPTGGVLLAGLAFSQRINALQSNICHSKEIVENTDWRGVHFGIEEHSSGPGEEQAAHGPALGKEKGVAKAEAKQPPQTLRRKACFEAVRNNAR